MSRIKFRITELDPKHMEGKQVVIKVENVNVELGEVLVTPIAWQQDKPAIDLILGKDYTVTIGSKQPVAGPKEISVREVLNQLTKHLESEILSGKKI